MSSAHDVSADVVSLTARRSYRADYKGLACAQVRAGRERLGLGHDEFAEYLSGLLGRKIPAQLAKRWEQSNIPPGDVLLASNGQMPSRSLLETVPPAFPAGALAGPWVTCYQFDHGGKPHHHADIAVITATSGSRIRAVNHPPEPHSEGRARPFRNEISATLAGRHLVGEWVNTSDTRYYGSVQLAVHSGEAVMEGIYAGVGSDVEVSEGDWKWVRLEVPPGADLAGITLRDPVALYELVMSRSCNDAPLTLDDVRED